MKQLIYICLFCLITASCATNKKVSLEKDNQKMHRLVVKKDNNSINYYSESFIEEKEKCNKQENYGEIMNNTETDLTTESKAKIEKDGGMLKVLENNLSKENFDKLNQRISFSIGVVLDQHTTIYGYQLNIYNKNIKNIVLSDTEVKNLFNYVESLKFTFINKYSGNFKIASFINYNMKK